MDVEVDVEQSGQDALRAELGSKPTLDEGVELRRLQGSSLSSLGF
jgi:hypothetical protein